MSKIAHLAGLEILDSRGNPTVQATAVLESGAFAVARVPSGASTGMHEAIELRDKDAKRYGGKGVSKAVAAINGEILKGVKGLDAEDQAGLDRKLCEIDRTPNKGRLGANAILGVSIAVARAAAAEKKVPLYRHLADREEYTLPVPMVNVLNGGQHADNNVDFQEFMIVPLGLPTFSQALRAVTETFHTLKAILNRKGYETATGDEGGFAPRLKSNEEPMELLVKAIKKAGYKPGKDICIALDPATSEFYNAKKKAYIFNKSDGSKKSASDMRKLWLSWVKKYPVVSIEDGFAENDTEGWKKGTEKLGPKIQLVGDDLFVTNPQIFKKGIAEGLGNSILIKLNQIGTLSETLECIEMARQSKYTFIISHRSGETEDTTIADLAVATGSGQIKTGSTCRGERIAKYNRLLEIEAELGKRAHYAGRAAFANWLS
jgi:enolase